MTVDEPSAPVLAEIWALLEQQRLKLDEHAAEIRELRAENLRLRSTVQALGSVRSRPPDAAPRRLSRANLFKVAAAGAAVAGVGSVMQAGSPRVAASTGGNLLAGHQNTAENSTSIYYDGPAPTGMLFVVDDDGDMGQVSPYPAAVGGWSFGNAGTANGVYGFTIVSGGRGVVGWNNDTSSNSGYGVYGRVGNSGAHSAGVYGEATNTSPGTSTSGVYGVCQGTGTSSANGNGVYGYHAGGGFGVYGASASGHGVVGSAASAGKAGVVGQASAGSAYGILGQSKGNPGAFAAVFQGNVSVTGGSTTVHNPSGHAILGITDALGYGGLSGATTTAGAAGLIGSNSNVSGAFGGLIYGPLVVTGTKSAAVIHPDGSRRLVYCVEMPESYLEDVGRAQLVQGRAEVEICPDFAPLIDTSNYFVFLTSHDLHTEALAVTHLHHDRFVVRERNGGTGSGSFQYRIMGKRVDVDAVRLPSFDVPEPGIVGALHAPKVPDVAERSLPDRP